MSSSHGPIRQIGYVVEDLEAAVGQWRSLTQRGPWTCFKGAVLEGRLGEHPVTVTIDVALGYIDDLEIELISPRSSVTPYHGADGRLLVGVHHVAWFAEDIAKSVEQARARGMCVMFEATNPVTKVAYLESATAPGQRIEFIEYTADGLAGWQQRVAAARNWDGTNPVQVYDLG
jgi:methylmalonyl-CoA/ethylmalonyl-CoA epimerase